MKPMARRPQPIIIGLIWALTGEALAIVIVLAAVWLFLAFAPGPK